MYRDLTEIQQLQMCSAVLKSKINHSINEVLKSGLDNLFPERIFKCAELSKIENVQIYLSKSAVKG